MGMGEEWAWGFLLGLWECLGTRERWWLHKIENVLNATELFTLRCLRHVNRTSLFKKLEKL